MVRRACLKGFEVVVTVDFYFLLRLFVSEVREKCVGECKEQGHDVAGPRAYSLALLEPTFDARMCDDGERLRNLMVGVRFVEVFWSGYGSGLITC